MKGRPCGGVTEWAFASIVNSFSRRVVNVRCLTAGGFASRRGMLPGLYARANSRRRTWVST